MAASLADDGVAAVKAGKYAEGIQKLTEALDERAAPLWHIERSKAYLRTSQFDLALQDAESALHISFDRANRQHMAEAQLRRAITLFRMGRFADADICAFWATRLIDGAKAMEDDGQQHQVDSNGDYAVRAKDLQDKISTDGKPLFKASRENNLAEATRQTAETRLKNQALSWRLQALTQMEKLPVGADGRKPHLVEKYPVPSVIKGLPPPTPPSTVEVTDVGSENVSTTNVASSTSGHGAWEKIWAQYHEVYTQQKIRCSFYQTDTSLTVDLFLKNLTPAQVAVNSMTQAIKITPAEGASLGTYSGAMVLMLHGEINPQATKYNVKSMKIELILQKKTAGKWPALRCDDAEIVDNLSISPSQGTFASRFIGFVMTLGYEDPKELELPDFDSDPSAWYAVLLGKLQSKLLERSGLLSAPDADVPMIDKPAETATSVLDQDMSTTMSSGSTSVYPTSSRKGPINWDSIDDDEDEEDVSKKDVNSFFQQIYKDADEDTKRAMMKSFVESNGTALSTSWSDAKRKSYETQPPNGTEVKKW
ncbi:SGS-domain-containing protein [Astrocystis sublimbata]|nr:SGS-domain-containing protein [Astrocystis sublimbata]